MDSLGFEGFDRGALATFNLSSHPIISSGCSYCAATPNGVRLQGSVTVTELVDEDDRLGRVEAELTVTYLREVVDGEFILREWLLIDWNAGDASTSIELIIEHDPPRWLPDERYQASFVPIESGSESRTGPWILIEPLTGAFSETSSDTNSDPTPETTSNTIIQGCLPDNAFCDESTRPDLELATTLVEARAPEEVQQPPIFSPIEATPTDGENPTKLELLRGAFDMGTVVENSSPWCTGGEGEVQSHGSWKVNGSRGATYSPLGTWLDALALPRTSITITDGIWSEVDFEDSACGSLVDGNGILRLGISIR